MAKSAPSAGHKVKFIQAVHEIAGRGLSERGRMWIRSISGGTSYGGMSKGGDVIIINDYEREKAEDLDIHFASVSLDSIETKEVSVSETETGIIVFTPTGESVVGVFGSCVVPITLPSLDGVMESSSKHSIKSHQVEALGRAFGKVSSAYKCTPVLLGSVPYLACHVGGRKWDMSVICKAKKTTDSIIDALSTGWIRSSTRGPGRLKWDVVPHKVRRLMAIELGITKRRFLPSKEEELLKLDASTAFSGLSVECIIDIGRELGMKAKVVTAKEVLKTLLDDKGVEGKA